MSGTASGDTATLSPASSFSVAWLRSWSELSAGLALSICTALMSSSTPPPTWKDAMEIPKKRSSCSPARALVAITRKTVSVLTQIVRCRWAGVRRDVKWMKNGITPIGFSTASSVSSGFR
jgi:hypothetical protein